MKILGILNITTDSFSDGGRYLQEADVEKRISELVRAKADIIDIGVESSNPDGADVPKEEQKRRLNLAFKFLRDIEIPLSIDSYHPDIIQFALDNGVSIINDISGFQNPQVRLLLKKYPVLGIMMFNRNFKKPRAIGFSDSVNNNPKDYNRDTILNYIHSFFVKQLELIKSEDISSEKIILDPGMGFFLGKDPYYSFHILKNLNHIKDLGYPVCISLSRKSFLGRIIRKPPAFRDAASLSLELACYQNDVDFIRTHNVEQLRDAISVYDKFIDPESL
jgi:dihydropteroate synthase type 2/dihydropteroate synthase type 3